MWTVISVLIIMLTSVLGITELFRRFWLYITRPSDDPPRIMVVFLKDDICLEQLHNAIEYISWEGGRLFSAIAFIDCGISEENKTKIKEIVNGHSNMVFEEEDLMDCIRSYK